MQVKIFVPRTFRVNLIPLFISPYILSMYFVCRHSHPYRLYHIKPCLSSANTILIKKYKNKALAWGLLFVWYHNNGTPASPQTRTVSSSQMLDCTSPICAQPIISMHRRDCPIPPPIVRGSSSARSILWNGSALRSLWSAIVSWRSSYSASTRIPIDEISSARPSVSSQKKISPFSCQSS